MRVHATALFSDRHAAHAAVEQLVQAGFARDTISVVMTGDTHEREFGAPSSANRARVGHARHAGVLATIVAGLVVLAAPGGRELRAGGPLVTALLRFGSSGTGVGALRPALVAAGLAEHEARFVDEGVRGGSIVLGVRASEGRGRLALQLLELSGGSALQAA